MLLFTQPPHPTQTNSKHTTQTLHKHYTNILNSIPPPTRITQYKKHIHTHLTRHALDNLPNNKILDTPPPTISSTETQLLRSERAHLTRPRCGHHPSLNTYKHFIDNTHTHLCPLCQVSPHTVTHLIDDCSNFTALRQEYNINSILQLWSDPVHVV